MIAVISIKAFICHSEQTFNIEYTLTRLGTVVFELAPSSHLNVITFY